MLAITSSSYSNRSTIPRKRKCPELQRKNKLRRLFGTGGAVMFKGSGFYETDYRSDSYKKGADADKKAKSESKSSDKSSDKSDKGSSKKGQFEIVLQHQIGHVVMKCPQCQHDFEPNESVNLPFLPAERCQMVDLGAWLDEERTVPYDGIDEEAELT